MFIQGDGEQNRKHGESDLTFEESLSLSAFLVVWKLSRVVLDDF